MNKNYPVQERYEDEIDLVDLIKILIKNYKLIVFITVLITGLGIGYGFYIKNKEVPVLEQQFQLEYPSISSKIIIENIFKDDKTVEEFFSYDIIKDLYGENNITLSIKEKQNWLNNIFKVTSPDKENSNYILTMGIPSNLDENKFFEIYYENLYKYIDKAIRNEISLKYKKVLENYELYKELVDNSQEKIKEIIGNDLKLEDSINSLYIVQALRELNSKTFAEKDTYTSLYNRFLNEKLNLENVLLQMGDYIKFRTSIYELESKVKLKLITIISFVLGGFLGIFTVFIKEFIKNIDWKN